MANNDNFLRRGNLKGEAPAETSLTPAQRAAEVMDARKKWKNSYEEPPVKPVNLSKPLVLGTAEGPFSKERYTGTLPPSSASFPRNSSLYGAPTLKGSGKRNKKAKKTKKAKKGKKARKQTQKRRV